ncbi:MAG: hypothetical protein AAF682_10325, partial [Planctomycetota bacterium]
MSAALASEPARSAPRHETMAVVRRAVRGVLEETPAYRNADPELQRSLAHRMVEVSMLAADLLTEDVRLSQKSAELARSKTGAREPPVAGALAAGDHLGLQATREAGATIEAIREAIDFPTFVTNLITGVFQSITRSSVEQLTGLGDLLTNVASSSDEFASSNVSENDVGSWLMSRFPYFAAEDDADGPALRVRDEVDLAEHYAELAQGLEATENEVSSVDEDDLMGTLGPLARRKIGRDRQTILATMVMMGIERVKVDAGRLHASMDMRVDTRSAAAQREASRFDTRVSTAGSASFGAGSWGASASMSATVGYVKSDDVQTQEEISSRAGLRSSVDLQFRTETVPLDRMTSPGAIQNIRSNSANPASWPAAADVSRSSIAATPATRPTAPNLGTIPSLPTPPPAPRPTPRPQPAAQDSARPTPTDAAARPSPTVPPPAPAGAAQPGGGGAQPGG